MRIGIDLGGTKIEAIALARAGLLEDLLKIENQDRVEDLIRERNASGA